MVHKDIPIRLVTDLPHTVPPFKKKLKERKHYFVTMFTNPNGNFQSENLYLSNRRGPCWLPSPIHKTLYGDSFSVNAFNNPTCISSQAQSIGQQLQWVADCLTTVSFNKPPCFWESILYFVYEIRKKTSDKRHYTAYFYWKMSSLNVQNLTNWILAQMKKSEETA